MTTMSTVVDPNRKLRLLSDFVAVRRDKASDTFGDGILVRPDNQKERWPTFGTVVDVGPGARLVTGEFVPLTVKVGDRVIIDSDAGQDWGPSWVNTNSKGKKAARPWHPDDVAICREREIYGIIEGEAGR